MDGNRLLEVCLNRANLDSHFGDCLGYTSGVADTAQSVTICLPQNARRGQVRDIVINYLREHPERRTLSSHVLVQEALVRVWPCPTPPPGGQPAPGSLF